MIFVGIFPNSRIQSLIWILYCSCRRSSTLLGCCTFCPAISRPSSTASRGGFSCGRKTSRTLCDSLEKIAILSRYQGRRDAADEFGWLDHSHKTIVSINFFSWKYLYFIVNYFYLYLLFIFIIIIYLLLNVNSFRESFESKLPLLWAKALELIYRQCQYSENMTVAVRALKALARALLTVADDAGQGWGILGAIGLRKGSQITIRLIIQFNLFSI